jgi:hypothetical protein
MPLVCYILCPAARLLEAHWYVSLSCDMARGQDVLGLSPSVRFCPGAVLVTLALSLQSLDALFLQSLDCILGRKKDESIG